MPTYEYKCLQCQSHFTVQARMQDPQPTQGPDCSGQDCRLQKCISRVFGQVAGASPAPVEKPQAKPQEKTEHVCAKYCSHHK